MRLAFIPCLCCLHASPGVLQKQCAWIGYAMADGAADLVIEAAVCMLAASQKYKQVTSTSACLSLQGFRYWVRKARPQKASTQTGSESEHEPLPKLRSLASDAGVDDGGSMPSHGHGPRARTPVAGAHSTMSCWDSVSSMDHMNIDDSGNIQIHSNAPIFFMHGVGLGLVSP